MIYYAVGSTAAWNALTPAQQAVYTAHYLDEKQLFDMLPSTHVDDITAHLISAVPISALIVSNSDFDGYTMLVDGKGFLSSISVANYYYSDTTQGDLTFINMRWCRTADAGATYQGYLIGSAGSGSRTFENCIYDGNGYEGQFIYDNGTSELRDYFVKKCVILNIDGQSGIFTRDSSSSSIFEHLTFYNCTVSASVLNITTDLTVRNVYIHAASGSCYSSSGSPTISDLITSDATSPEVPNRNISPNDAMVNPSGGVYRPKLFGPLDIGSVTTGIDYYINGVHADPNNVYAGAYGSSFGSGSGSKKKKRNIVVRQIIDENINRLT